MQVQLCKKSIDRLGGLIAVAGGMPLAAPTLEAFLTDLDALTADDG